MGNTGLSHFSEEEEHEEQAETLIWAPVERLVDRRGARCVLSFPPERSGLCLDTRQVS